MVHQKSNIYCNGMRDQNHWDTKIQFTFHKYENLIWWDKRETFASHQTDEVSDVSVWIRNRSTVSTSYVINSSQSFITNKFIQLRFKIIDSGPNSEFKWKINEKWRNDLFLFGFRLLDQSDGFCFLLDFYLILSSTVY